MIEIDNKIAKGTACMLSSKVIDRSLGLIGAIILARLLIPDGFGLVPTAMILIAFSFFMPQTRNLNADMEQFDTPRTRNLLITSLCAAVLAQSPGLAAKFPAEPTFELVIYLFAVRFAIQRFASIGAVIFRHNMRSDRIQILTRKAHGEPARQNPTFVLAAQLLDTCDRLTDRYVRLRRAFLSSGGCPDFAELASFSEAKESQYKVGPNTNPFRR